MAASMTGSAYTGGTSMRRKPESNGPSEFKAAKQEAHAEHKEGRQAARVGYAKAKATEHMGGPVAGPKPEAAKKFKNTSWSSPAKQQMVKSASSNPVSKTPSGSDSMNQAKTGGVSKSGGASVGMKLDVAPKPKVETV